MNEEPLATARRSGLRAVLACMVNETQVIPNTGLRTLRALAMIR
jgi:hypothetical protein